MGLAQVLSGKTEVSENLGTSETASAQKGAVKGDLSRSEARSESAAKLSLWDPAAVLMILSVYVTQFVAIGDRGFTQMSLWTMIGVLLLAAVVCVALIALRPQTLRPPSPSVLRYCCHRVRPPSTVAAAVLIAPSVAPIPRAETSCCYRQRDRPLRVMIAGS